MSDAGAAIADEFMRGTQLLRVGRCDEALLAFRVVYAHAQRDGRTDMMAAALCEIGWSCYRCGQAEQGLECAMGARLLWARLGNQVEVARAMAVQSFLLLDLGFADQANDLAGEALDLAQGEDDMAMLAFALNARGVVLTRSGQAERGQELIERAIGIAHQHNNIGAVAYYLLKLGVCHTVLAEQASAVGDTERATSERETAIELNAGAIAMAQRCGDLWTLRVTLCNNAQMLALQGRHNAALSALEQYAGSLDEPGIAPRIQFRIALGDVLLRAGRLDDACAMAIQAVALADATSLLDYQLTAVGKLAEILEAQGDAPAALVQFKRFHSLYVRKAGETAQRRARVEAMRAEDDSARSRADDQTDQAIGERRLRA
ncbi:MAG: hypothetical protein ACOH2N_12390 [Devosia sp.]